MGFGILFFGYFITFLMSLNTYGAVFALIGNYVIFSALGKISEYKHNIVRCIPFLLVMALCNILGVVEVLFSPSLEIVKTISDTLSLASSLLFNLFLFRSLFELGEDTEVAEVKVSAKLNAFAAIVYFSANVAVMIFANKYLIITAMILRLIFPLMALALIYKCFRFICAPEDVDMPIKPSRFKFINDFRERQAQKEEEAKRAREEKLRKSSAASSANHHKHKKKK